MQSGIQTRGSTPTWRGTTDEQFAFGCLTEGEATLYEDLAWVLLAGLSVDTAYWDSTLEWRLKYARDAVIFSESPYDFAWQLRYAVGARYLADAWLADGYWGVQSLYEAPPTSTVYWMHGFAESRTREAPLTLALACQYAAAPPGFERAAEDSLGAFLLFAFLGRNLTTDGLHPSEESWQRPLAWRQDQLEVFGDGLGRTALAWRIRFAEERVAREIRDELAPRPSLGLRVLQHGTELELLASDDRSVLDEWRGTDPERCPEPPER